MSQLHILSDQSVGPYRLVHDTNGLDWDELSELYRVAPLGNKPVSHLQTVFGNSLYACFAYANDQLVGAGRALADGADCAYIADLAVHPKHQGIGVGTHIISELVASASRHTKIILYAVPGKEGFYTKLGFRRMRTAMAIWSDPERATSIGLITSETDGGVHKH